MVEVTDALMAAALAVRDVRNKYDETWDDTWDEVAEAVVEALRPHLLPSVDAMHRAIAEPGEVLPRPRGADGKWVPLYEWQTQAILTVAAQAIPREEPDA